LVAEFSSQLRSLKQLRIIMGDTMGKLLHTTPTPAYTIPIANTMATGVGLIHGVSCIVSGAKKWSIVRRGIWSYSQVWGC
jgi:hypothetical protein